MWHLLVGESARAGLHATDRPDLFLVFDLVSAETQAASTALRFLPLSGLAAQPERDTLEIRFMIKQQVSTCKNAIRFLCLNS